MKVLVIGSGGREHALVWKISQSSMVRKIYWSPGNSSLSPEDRIECVPIPVEKIRELADFAEKEGMDLTVVGPEIPLVLGVGDEFRKRKLRIFGPSQSGARLEGSKIFSKKFFVKHHIPTGKAEIFTNPDLALQYALKQPRPIVVKADGLAAGKGVVICTTDQEVQQAIEDMMRGEIFGEAGKQVLIEECLVGTELSVHALTDGNSYQILASAQDHKRIFDGDRGPNTGGMGTYSPTPLYTPELEKVIRAEIFDRTLKGLQAEGIPFCGVLYAGLMLTRDGIKILEYNCRFGDPETQVILTRMESDLVPVLLAACDGHLDRVKIQWKDQSSVCVVLASEGYPGNYRKGDVIEGLNEAQYDQNIQIFHAGTMGKDGQVLTSGGRVLGITAQGNGLPDTIKRAYSAVDRIKFKGMQFRKDIASKGLS